MHMDRHAALFGVAHKSMCGGDGMDSVEHGGRIAKMEGVAAVGCIDA